MCMCMCMCNSNHNNNNDNDNNITCFSPAKRPRRALERLWRGMYKQTTTNTNICVYIYIYIYIHVPMYYIASGMLHVVPRYAAGTHSLLEPDTSEAHQLNSRVWRLKQVAQVAITWNIFLKFTLTTTLISKRSVNQKDSQMSF